MKKYAELIKYKFLEDFAINNNQIEDISNLDSFLSQLKYLKKFNIEKNNIKYEKDKDKDKNNQVKDEEKDKDIIGKVIKKYKNLNINY